MISLGSLSEDSAAMKELKAGCDTHRGETKALTVELQQSTKSRRTEATIDDDDFDMTLFVILVFSGIPLGDNNRSYLFTKR